MSGNVYSSKEEGLFCVEVPGQPNVYRQATPEDLKASRAAHEVTDCDCQKRHDGTRGGCWYDQDVWPWYVRCCAICNKGCETI